MSAAGAVLRDSLTNVNGTLFFRASDPVQRSGAMEERRDDDGH